jgi:hypothetical protein
MAVLMSSGELDRLDVLTRLDAGAMSVRDVEAITGLCRRQIFRLLHRFRQDGAAGVVSRRRGRPSNRRLPEPMRIRIIDLVRTHYSDFGPTFAAEMLADRHDLHLGRETLRQLMISAGIWTDRRARRTRVYQPRYRRDCLGELIQIDGSLHWWFEDRGPQTSMLVFIDDATSRIMHLRLVPAESAFAYLESTRAYIEQHGKPIAFYSDKHSVFRVHTASSKRSDGMTQFGRALHDLNIEIICANSAPAKGRVERCHQTLQDRLVKEMRLAGIADIDTANAFLPDFIERHNTRFAKDPFNPKDLHRPLAQHENLDDVMCWREERAVSSALSLHYNKVIFILDPNPISRSLARKKVTVHDFPDGRLEIRHEGVSLPYRIFDKLRQVHQAQVLDQKRLGAALDMAKELQTARPEGKRNTTPNRRGQVHGVFILAEPADETPKPKRRVGRRTLEEKRRALA